jgi:hypothetical protein
MNCEEFHFFNLFFGRRVARFGAADDDSSTVLVQPTWLVLT